MAHTVRRKNAPHTKAFYVTPADELTQWDLKYRGMTDPVRCHKRLNAKFHSDALHLGNPPAHFRRALVRQARRKSDGVLKRALREDALEGYVDGRPKRDAHWLWW